MEVWGHAGDSGPAISAARHHTVLGGRASMNGTDNLLRIWTSSLTFKQTKFLKYNFSQWLTTSLLFIKNHLKHSCKQPSLKHPSLQRTGTAGKQHTAMTYRKSLPQQQKYCI